jgi:PIF1-like helicase
VSEETLLDRYKLRYNPEEQQNRLNQLNISKPNNEEQNNVYNSIVALIESQIQHPENPAVFIDLRGDAGTGKSLLIQKIVLYIRGRDHIVIGSCSTALAAQVYPTLGFTTSHTAYDIEVLDEYERNIADGPIECKMSTAKFQFVNSAVLHIIDEAFSLHRECFEAIITALDEGKGKLFILTGDEKQCLPVVPHGNRFDIINATIFSSELWKKFQHFRLIRNMRLEDTHMMEAEQTEQVKYANMLTSIGYGSTFEGNCTLHDEGSNEDESHLIIKGIENFVADDGNGNSNVITDEILNWLYPGLIYDPNIAKDVTIVANTNKEIELWNERISALNPNAEQIMISEDYFSEVDDPKKILAGKSYY